MKIVNISSKRIPIRTLNGVLLSSISAPKLGSIAIKAVLDDSRIYLSHVDEIIVLTTGIGQSACILQAFITKSNLHVRKRIKGYL